MNWTDITDNLTTTLHRLGRRFPYVDRDLLSEPPQDILGLAPHIAARHDLTPREASEELADWAFVESLARQASERGLD